MLCARPLLYVVCSKRVPLRKRRLITLILILEGGNSSMLSVIFSLRFLEEIHLFPM